MKKTKQQIKYEDDFNFVIKSLLVIAGLIVFLELYAIHKGIDGAMFGSAMVALGTVGGYILKTFLQLLKRK